MRDVEWILFDTETTGLSAPIFVVEIAAQRMRGWEKLGPSFRRLLDHGADVPAEASRVHGYTREILERDGEPPRDVYAQFADYVGSLPLVAYNLAYDLDMVLVPEWRRLSVAPIGRRGFCAFSLTRRLLDPVPAGNCKLQTLRQYFRLPERGAHTAMGDVETVIDLLQKVLGPLVADRGLETWQSIQDYSEAEWFPRRIAFGKHKGRDFQEAREDDDLKSWIAWLSSSSNPRSAAMGRWYLAQLSGPRREQAAKAGYRLADDEAAAAAAADKSEQAPGGVNLVLYIDPDIARFQALIEIARSRLAELSAEFTTLKRDVDAVNAALFQRLISHYRRRDRLALLVKHRREFLETLLHEGEDEAEDHAKTYRRAQEDADKNFEDARKKAEQTTSLSDEEKAEIKAIWRELAKTYHPDQCGMDEHKRQLYDKLMAAINKARDEGNIALLREIAADPMAYMRKQGWGVPETDGRIDLQSLKALYEQLSLQIIQQIEDLGTLKTSNAFEIFLFCRAGEDAFEHLVDHHLIMLEQEAEQLQKDADKLFVEIRELLGTAPPF